MREVKEKMCKRFNYKAIPASSVSAWLALIAVSLVLTACKASEDLKPRSSGAANTSAPGSAPKSNRVDACALLSKVDVEKIIGQSVNSADLSRATEGTGTMAAFSQCSYQTSSGQTIELFVRRSPVADNTPESIAQLRETMKAVSNKEPVEVAEVGSTAFWTASKQLHVFAGSNVYLYVTMMGFKDDSAAKASATGLARQALSKLQ